MTEAVERLTRAEIVESVRRNVGVSLPKAQALVEAIIGTMMDAIECGEDVKIANFGTFRILEKGARPGRNPKTGEDHVVSARRTLSFRPSGKIKDRVSGVSD